MAEHQPARPSAAGRRPDAAARRLTLGLVTANIHLGVGATLWSGVLAAAERNDVNVVCFPGGPLWPDGEPRGALYDLIGPERLDGVICWTSTLGLPAAGERAGQLVARLRDLPVVSLNRALEGHETLLLDSRSGMREAVGHLVREHGRRRLACVRGPLSNPVTLDRYRAWTEALASHRIPLDRSLVGASPDFGGGAGAAALRVLLDVRGLRPGRDFDALVACSDVLGADALRFLTGRGVRVPEDVAVVSFNDSVEARLADPPLTSVALPFAELGALAVDTLVARLRGTAPPARGAVPGTLVTRRSCGCQSALVTQGARDEYPADGDGGGDGRGRGVADLGAVFAGLPGAGAGDGLAAAFRADLDGDAPGTAFLDLLERLVGGGAPTRDTVAAWDRALLRARATALPRLPEAARARAERLFGQARLLVADKAHRLLEYERWAEEQDARKLRELATALTTAVDIDALTGALARHLPGMGVPHCRLVLYRGDGHGTGPGRARLVPAPEEAAAGHEEPAYPASLLLPDALLPRDRRFTLVLEPLHIGGEQLGFAVFDTGPGGGAAHRGALYRALGDQVSAALKGIRLFDEVRRARDAAERANRLKTRLLNNATDELRTPVESILRHTADGGPGALRLAHGDAARLLRLIDDLLDLSRSEIDDLGLTRRMLDPRPLVEQVFHEVARARPDGRAWRLHLPPHLPAIRADPGRLRRILRNLLTTAAGPADPEGPGVLLTADAHPPLLAVRVLGPGLAALPGRAEDLFQPFASDRPGSRLGLAIARRLAVLHGGSVTLDGGEGPAAGDGPRGFRLHLPLPTPAEPPGALPAPGAVPARSRVLLAATAAAPPDEPPPEIAALARRRGLPLRRLHPDDDLAGVVADLTARGEPAAVAWDAGRAAPQEWPSVQRLHDHPALRHTPFLLYGPVAGDDLAGALSALRPAGLADPVVVVDGSAESREALRRIAAAVLPGRAVRTAADGGGALGLFEQDVPCLLVVARTLPDMDGFDVVERMYDRAGHFGVPVLMLGERGPAYSDIERAGPYPGLLLLGRDILTEQETARLLAGMAERGEPGAHRTGAPVRHAMAYLERNYRRRVSRWQVAQAVGLSEDHLSRLFHRELGLTLWEYLTRVRVQRAKERLRQSDDSVQAVARAVGFADRAYFSRVFRKVTGVAPHAYREVS
ncbi:substrate-binding domain-containing protein [Streptomyces capparidis]